MTIIYLVVSNQVIWLATLSTFFTLTKDSGKFIWISILRCYYFIFHRLGSHQRNMEIFVHNTVPNLLVIMSTQRPSNDSFEHWLQNNGSRNKSKDFCYETLITIAYLMQLFEKLITSNKISSRTKYSLWYFAIFLIL